MPKCSKCDAVQSKMNKGNLCKKCFHAKHNLSNKVIPDDNDPFNSTLMDQEDRTIVDLIKEHMQRESQWNRETHQLLSEQIDFLKAEITEKNDIIRDLLKLKYYMPPEGNKDIINYTNTALPMGNEHRLQNKSITKSDRVLISPDVSTNDALTNDVYKNIERDDIIPLEIHDNNEWINNRKNNICITRNNSRRSDVANYVEHPNRFDSLRLNTEDNYGINYNDDDKYVDDIQKSATQKRMFTTPTIYNKRPHIVTQDYPEGNYIKLPVKPGHNQYNQALRDGKTTVIFSTSITKGIAVRDFNNFFKLGTARFRRFHGATAKYMKHYVLPTLVDECPQVVLLQCGGNDLPTPKQNPKPVEDIAKEIIETAKICENHGVDQIFIGSVITRKQGYVDRRRRELNTVLKGMCYEFGFVYVDNDNIEHKHLSNDGVHLSNEGSDILELNYLHTLNNIF